jgi:hypothetical protein
MNDIDLFLIEIDDHAGRHYTENDHVAIIDFFKGILKYIKPHCAHGLIYLSDDHEMLVNNDLGGLTINISPHKLLSGSVSDPKNMDVVMAWKIQCKQTCD